MQKSGTGTEAQPDIISSGHRNLIQVILSFIPHLTKLKDLSTSLTLVQTSLGNICIQWQVNIGLDFYVHLKWILVMNLSSCGKLSLISLWSSVQSFVKLLSARTKKWSLFTHPGLIQRQHNPFFFFPGVNSPDVWRQQELRVLGKLCTGWKGSHEGALEIKSPGKEVI